MICRFCGKTYSDRGIRNHENQCRENPNSVIQHKPAGFKGGLTPWNKGLTKQTDARVAKNAASISSAISGHNVTAATRLKLSNTAKKRGLGGYNPLGGRGKKGWYNGIWCDSSWELAFVIYNIEHNIPVRKCKEVRLYEWKGTTRKYHPDFVVDGVITEIKGYDSPQWQAKHTANPDVVVKFAKDLQHVFDYVTHKYGKDFIRLYGEMRELV